MASTPVKGGGPFYPQHGMNQQTPATQHLITGAVGTGAYSPVRSSTAVRRKKKATTTRKARSSTAARKPKRAASRSTSARSGSRLVKGSAAAKRRMSQLRALRKK